MGVLQISLDATTSMIFAISFGIAVDDTIHFLSKLRLELAKTQNLEKALYHTTLGNRAPHYCNKYYSVLWFPCYALCQGTRNDVCWVAC